MNNYLADIMTQLFGHSVLEDAPVDPSAGQDYGSTGGYSPTELIRLGLLHPGKLSNQNKFLQGIHPGTRPVYQTNANGAPVDDSGTPIQKDPAPNLPAPDPEDTNKIVDIIKELFPEQPEAPTAKPSKPPAPVPANPKPSPSPKPPAPTRPVLPNPYASGHGGGTGNTGSTTTNPYSGSRYY